MIVAFEMSLAGRFLSEEAHRLRGLGQTHASRMTGDGAETLRVVLARDIALYSPLATTYALGIQRVREEWPDNDENHEGL